MIFTGCPPGRTAFSYLCEELCCTKKGFEAIRVRQESCSDILLTIRKMQLLRIVGVFLQQLKDFPDFQILTRKVLFQLSI